MTESPVVNAATFFFLPCPYCHTSSTCVCQEQKNVVLLYFLCCPIFFKETTKFNKKAFLHFFVFVYAFVNHLWYMTFLFIQVSCF